MTSKFPGRFLQTMFMAYILIVNNVHNIPNQNNSEQLENSPLALTLVLPNHTLSQIHSASTETECTTICWLNRIQNVWLLFACAISILTCLIIYSYLDNISLVRECVLLYCYKDVIAISIFLRVLILVKWIISYSKPNASENMTVGIMPAKLLAFGIFSFGLYTLLILNVISSIRLHVTKTMVLDPPMPWENDEALLMKKIRLAAGIISVTYPAIFYLLQIYPRMYYDFVTLKVEIPISSFVFSGILVFFLATFVITIMVEMCYKTCNPHKNQSTFPRQINYMVLTNLIVYGYFLFEITFKFLDSNTRWMVFQLLISVLGLTTPLIAIVRSKKLSSYSIKYLKEKYDNAYLYYMYVIPFLLATFMYLSLMTLYSFVDV